MQMVYKESIQTTREQYNFRLYIFFIESLNDLGNRTSFCLIQDSTLVLKDDGKMPGDFKTIHLIPLALYL